MLINFLRSSITNFYRFIKFFSKNWRIILMDFHDIFNHQVEEFMCELSNLKLKNFSKNSESEFISLSSDSQPNFTTSKQQQAALALMENIKWETYYRNLLDQRCRLINVLKVAEIAFWNWGGIHELRFYRFTLTFCMIDDCFVCKLASHIFHTKCLLTCRSKKILFEREILIKSVFVFTWSIFMLGWMGWLFAKSP